MKRMHFKSLNNTYHFTLFMSMSVLLMGARAGWTQQTKPVDKAAIERRLGQPPSYIEPLDQNYLMRFVRRVIVRRLLDNQRYEIGYVPLTLTDLKCTVAVTLRDKGILVGSGDSKTLPIVEASRQAAEAALSTARKKRNLNADDVTNMSLEIELIGPRERVGNCNDETEKLIPHFEPAIHGIAFLLEGKEVLVKPSQLISIESYCQQEWKLDHQCNRYIVAIDNFKQKMGLFKDPPDRKPATIGVFRFRTMHLYQSRSRQKPTPLIAGMRFIQPTEINHASLAATVDDLAGFIRYRQNPNGIFAYEFLPGRDIYWPKAQNWIRQAATTWALAVHARKFNDKASKQALTRAIEAFRKMVKPLLGRSDAAYLHTPDGRHALGTTALFCLAL
ncbi:MAG: hypothetical protein JSV03_14745, partial [Planctomycetota bacterium]